MKTRVESIASSPAATFSAPPQRISMIPTSIFYGLQALLVVPAEVFFFRGDIEVSIACIAAAVLALCVTCLFFGLLHHASWSVLPARYRATTPGKAVGYLFIPFFDLYWAFVSFVRLADGYNALAAEHPHWNLRNLRGWAEAKAVLYVCYWTLAFIPGLASLVCVTDFIVFVFFYRGVVKNANSVIEQSTVKA